MFYCSVCYTLISTNVIINMLSIWLVKRITCVTWLVDVELVGVTWGHLQCLQGQNNVPPGDARNTNSRGDTQLQWG